MPGTISKIFCKVGDKVKKGDPIYAIESMKMQHTIKASFDCKVLKIDVKDGQFVESGKAIIELDI